MNLREINGPALREFEELCRDTLEAVQRESLSLERLPEGEEDRDPLIVDGVLVRQPAPRRLRGKLTVRW